MPLKWYTIIHNNITSTAHTHTHTHTERSTHTHAHTHTHTHTERSTHTHAHTHTHTHTHTERSTHAHTHTHTHTCTATSLSSGVLLHWLLWIHLTTKSKHTHTHTHTHYMHHTRTHTHTHTHTHTQSQQSFIKVFASLVSVNSPHLVFGTTCAHSLTQHIWAADLQVPRSSGELPPHWLSWLPRHVKQIPLAVAPKNSLHWIEC